jgi:AcrR family transcriptional regulator
MEDQRETFDPGSQEAQHDLPRRERERLLRRQLMLDTACAVFAEKGYAHATLDEVAQRAEFGKGTIYNYFEGGKEEILFAIFNDLYDSMCRLIEETFSPELVHEKPFRDVFEGFLTALFAFFQERMDQFMIMIKEGHRIGEYDQPDKVAYFLEQSERIIRALTPALEAAMEKGAIRRLPAASIAHMIMGNVKGYQMHMCMEGCRCGAMMFGGNAINGKDHKENGSPAWSPPSPDQSARFISTFLLDGILERG